MQLQNLIAAGARNFVLFNAPPGGCLPLFLTLFQWRSPILDECGCLAEYNEAAQAYNVELNTTLQQLQQAFPQTVFRLLDFYAAFYEILKNVERYGKETTKLCNSSPLITYLVGVGVESIFVENYPFVYMCPEYHLHDLSEFFSLTSSIFCI